MMKIWILTIGTSDVQLESEATNRTKPLADKQLSKKIWSTWAADFEEDWEVAFQPSQSFSDVNETYRIPPRALGLVYQGSSEAQQEEMRSYLVFPLLDNFLKSFPENPPPDVIFLLLTDQSALFKTDLERRNPRCPFWQDTMALEPIATHYLREKLGQHIQIEPIILAPQTPDESLADWNAVLNLVQEKFKDLKLGDQPLQDLKYDRVYVSHQAGTPALSSAVQFVSLAMFREAVQFLVSRENQDFAPTAPSELIPQSSYLGALRIQEAKALLKRYDYTSVRDILGLTNATELTGDQKELKTLLDAGEQWNFAKFEEFAEELAKLTSPELQALVQSVSDRRQHYWWTAYEAAYLAFVRLDQKNAVEAFFHSFRAVEGLISKWAEVNFPTHVDPNNDSPKLKASILEVPDLNYFGKSKYKDHKQKLIEQGDVILSGFPLFTLLRSAKPNWKKDCNELTSFIEEIAPARNKIFHRLKGLKIDDVFHYWLIPTEKTYEDKIQLLENKLLSYLNFVIDQKFVSINDASLMAKVHDELVNAIENL